MTAETGLLSRLRRARSGDAAGAREAVLLLGNYRPAIVMVRALSRTGYRTVLGAGGEGGAEYSRFIDEVWQHPSVTAAPQAMLRALTELLDRRRDITVIFPVSEECVMFCAAYGEYLVPRVAIASPRPDIVRTCVDKRALLSLAVANGIAVEPFCTVQTHDELVLAARDLGYPLVIRPIGPVNRLCGRKALIVRDPAEQKRLLPAWPQEQEALLLQRMAHGPRRNVYFAALDGRVVRSLETAIIRTDASDGTGLAVEGVTCAPSPGLSRDTATLVAALNYTGIGLTQFIVDEAAGTSCLLELNPRIAGSHAVPEAAGLDLTGLAVSLAQGRTGDAGRSIVPRSFRYAWTYGDLRGLAAALANGDVGPAEAAVWFARAALTLLRADVHMTWSVSDPAPALALFLRHLPGMHRLLNLVPGSRARSGWKHASAKR